MHQKLVKYVFSPLHEKIIGRKTYYYLELLEEQQGATKERLEELKFEKLKKLLVHADRNVAFYTSRFADVGFNPAGMQSIEDFKVIPVLTKAEIRKNIESMKWNQCPGGLHRYNTGGSSGDPLVFYFDRRRQAYDAAARALTHRWWGIDVGDKELYFWGSPLEITKQDKFKDLRDWLTSELLISAFEISPDKIPIFVQQFRKFKPKCVFGYPSTIALFCHVAKNQNLYLHDLGVRVVFCTAEVLYQHQRETISEYFGGVPVVDSYGSREGGFISHQCREGTYHVMDPNYVIEYLQDGKEARPGEVGEVVITHLDAWGMPFIRYRTGDVAQHGKTQCKCGRGFSAMENIRGRTTDFIVTPDGRWQHALSLIYVVRDIEGVAEFRIIQDDVDDVKVMLKVHKDIYSPDGNERIISGFKKRMGQEVKVTLEVVDEIPRDASGKYRYVISKVAEGGFR
jgi:phenylacetate-CoA ligase